MVRLIGESDGVAYGFRKSTILEGGGCSCAFLSNSFVGGQSDWALRLADRSMAAAHRISGQTMRYAVIAQLIFGRSEPGFVHAQNATARAQTRLALIQTAMARREAALARTQTEMVRVLANHPVVCPRPNFAINVPEISEIADKRPI